VNPKAFTHSPIANVQATSAATIRFTAEDEKLTREGLDSLAGAGKLGAVVAQFPISFKNTDENRAYLRKLIAMFQHYPLAIEVRHSDWNDRTLLRKIATLGVGFVNVDRPLLGKALRGTTHVTGSTGYVRLHGRNYHQRFAAEKSEDRYTSCTHQISSNTGRNALKRSVSKHSGHLSLPIIITSVAAVNASELKSMLSGKKV